MYGPEILARFLSTPGPADKYGNHWQYNSRSDRHSKVGCWGIALDLMTASSLLRRHVEEGIVVLGVNHPMRDFATGRSKDLDLVIARPAAEVPENAVTFAGLGAKYGIELTDREQGALDALPRFPVAPVGAVLIALEAKATMTAHVKSLPRLYDELNSSHLCVHGASRQALAIGYVQVNSATEFVSSVRNNFLLGTRATLVSTHRQPGDTERVIAKVGEISRRSASSENGFDGIGITVVDLANDGTAVKIVNQGPAPRHGDPFHYDGMIIRMANEYDTTFGNI